MTSQRIKGLVLAAALAVTSITGRAFAQAADDARGPDGDKDYSALINKAVQLGSLNDQIRRTEGWQADEGAAKHAAPAGMKEKLKSGIAETAPKIVLTPSLSEQDADVIIGKFKKAGDDVPAYVTALEGHTGSLHECQAQLVKPGVDKDAKLAEIVSNCAVTLHDSRPAPVTPKAPVQAQAPAPEKAGGITAVFQSGPSRTVVIGGALLGLGIGAAGIAAARRRAKKGDAPAPRKAEKPKFDL
jgi:hypothetical protein